MARDFLYLLCLIYTNIESANSQYIILGKRVNNRSACDDSNKTTRVEHFFNVIFHEFHTSPPVCVCVQMCKDQPAYCYPNGCFKRIDNRTKVNDTHLQNDGSKTTFLVDEGNNFTHALKKADVSEKAQRQTGVTRDFFSDPLKNIYKSLFKHRKMPRVQLRYNLREQVKNMKSDVLKQNDNILKTRWPKAHHKTIHYQRIQPTNGKYNERKRPNAGNTDVWFSHPGSQEPYTSKYFKRDLIRTQSSNSDDRSMNIEEQNDVTNKRFTVETLIENLIGNSFNGTNDTKIELSVNFNDVKVDDKNSYVNLTNESILKNSTNETSDQNEIMSVYSLNLTNENRHENKYTDDNIVSEAVKKWSNYAFNEMIAALSKQIDKQNNTSMEMIKRSDHLSLWKSNSLENSTNTNVTEIGDSKTLKSGIKQLNFTNSNNYLEKAVFKNTNAARVKVNQ